MKTCLYCGKRYPDDVVTCPVDGQPLADNDGGRKKTTLIPKPAFDIKLLSPISRSGTYRVFVQHADLIFIQTEDGGNSLVKTLAHFLGPLGNLIPLAFWLFDKSKSTERHARIEEVNSDELLRESDANFKLHVSEIRDAFVEPPSRITSSAQAGRLKLLVRHGEKFEFGFAEPADINSAIHLLTPLLNSTLRISPQWNQESRQFEKRKKG